MGRIVVSRDRELAVAADAFERMRSGPTALLVEGEPGIGKTTVWRAAVDAARERGLGVLEAHPAEAESMLSYATLGDLLGPVIDHALTGLPPPQRRALEVALLLADPEAEPPDQRAIAVALLAALRTLAAGDGLVVAVDDLQWLDPDSERALAFALRRLTDEPLLALLARRPATGPPLGLDAARVRLEPLDPTALHVLLARVLGLTLARPLLLRVHDASGGNPLYALELGRALAGAEGELAAGAPLPVPDTLRDVLDSRLAGVSSDAREALAVTAALAYPTRAIVVALAGAGVDEAIGAGLLEAQGDRLRLAHPLYGSVATARLDAGRVRELHRRLAELVQMPEQRAAHLALAIEGRDPEAAEAVAAAARAAAARGAAGAALQLAEHALRLGPREPAQFALAASDFAFTAGDAAHARELLAPATEAADARVRVEAWVRLATLATYDGTMAEARDAAERALAEDVDDVALRAVIHRRLALVHLLLAELDAAERHAATAVELADGDARLQAQANLACVRALAGHRVDAELERALDPAATRTLASIDDSPAAIAGLLLMYRGELDEARSRLRAGLQLARTLGGDPLSTGLLFALSELESRAGKFDRALGYARRGLAASAQTGQATERSVLLFAEALALAHLGDEAARPSALEGLAIAERAGLRFAQAQNRWALGLLELSLGRAAEALAAIEPAVALLRDARVGDAGVVPVLPLAIEATAALGDAVAARGLLDELDAAARWPWLRAAAQRGRGLVSAAEGDTDTALAALGKGLVAAQELDRPFEVARTQFALGSAQRRARQWRAARVSLGEAERAFAALGAEGWAERARAEAARVGGRRTADRDKLTESELQIAALAADGRSNREIAGELFVSERTVEAHLTRTYRKLGVRSRTELARRLPS
jgi:DNA-binding CsgD family transcriptional regulator